MKTKADIIQLIENDELMMEIIKTASKLDLPDWWICAGFIRSKIWDTLHGFHDRTSIPDVDVIYFDSKNTDEWTEKSLEKQLKTMMPGIPWSVKNQARMHVINQLAPYTSSEDAISKFPETATALGVTLDKNNHLYLTAPCGMEDLIELNVKPTPYFIENTHLMRIYNERVLKKNWQATWPKITIHT